MFGNIHETMQKCNPLKNNISVSMRFKETFSFFFFFPVTYFDSFSDTVVPLAVLQ